ncbi:hypothetical protein [Amnibacterium kyonggiense]|uniref:hypothetical protein n=1 Tax=Amnibacterium kyonggiense TaxID=595671 RepID=UPI00106170C6|nr:hypothetical protein [Amnibacterium kyonggiense]
MQAVVLPALGGRLISLRHSSREFLWHDPSLLDDAFRPRVPVTPQPAGSPMESWQNWGGDKSWPAPQARGIADVGWHGPPDDVFDGGVYEVLDRRSEDTIRLRSAVDARTGLQQTRTIVLTDVGARIKTTITNRSTQPRTFAPWEVMQVAVDVEDETNGAIEVECAGGCRVAELVRWWGHVRIARKRDAVSIGFGDAVAKLGFPDATGRVRCRFADGARLALSFTPSPVAPESAPFQLWLQTPLARAPEDSGGWRPMHRLIELEPVGALTDLAPGESASVTADWTLLAEQRRSPTRVPKLRSGT